MFIRLLLLNILVVTDALNIMPAEIKKVTNAEYETLAALRHSLRQFLRFSEDTARASGITPRHHQALLAIKGFSGLGRVTMGELAERLQIRHHSAVGLADRLAAKGFLRRTSSTTDRRKVCLNLTPGGESVLEKLSVAHRDELRRVGPGIASFLRRLRNPKNQPKEII
jgi:DNA-binding MarR family transcriptional regulator